jgi:hypothetical protein
MKLTRIQARDLIDVLQAAADDEDCLADHATAFLKLSEELDDAQGADLDEDRVVTIEVEKGDL